MEELLQGLRAAAEPTRLRILALCAHAELTVSDLVEILGQSQPRVSRHLKLLVEAGLLTRNQEGAWAWYRAAERGGGAELARLLADLLPPDDPQHALDLRRLQGVSEGWATKAAAFFRRNAQDWDRIRSLHIDQGKVDAALRAALGSAPLGELLDIGTGTGHVLQLLGPQAESAVGIDTSRDMLNIARANLFHAGLRHCQVRQADMGKLPFMGGSFDTVTLDMALHYAERPGLAIAEAARVLRPGGRLLLVDFASHGMSLLREEHAHRWLGFTDASIAAWCREAGLVLAKPKRLAGDPLTVVLWSARRAANDPAAAAGERRLA